MFAFPRMTLGAYTTGSAETFQRCGMATRGLDSSSPFGRAFRATVIGLDAHAPADSRRDPRSARLG